MAKEKKIEINIKEEEVFSQEVRIPYEDAKKFEQEVKEFLASEKTKTIIKENTVSFTSPTVILSDEAEDYLISGMEIEEE